MWESTEKMDVDERGKSELQRAYLLMGFGRFEEALQVCDEVATYLEESALPGAIRGAILIAAGRPQEAMKELSRHCRAHPTSLLSEIYLAEACFLAGRSRRAWKILDRLWTRGVAESPFGELTENLRESWSQLEEVESRAPVLEVPLERTGSRRE